MCKSVIGGLKLERSDPGTRTLANQAVAVREINRVLKPGGYFLGAENLRGIELLHQLRVRYKKGNVGWRHFTMRELSELLNNFSVSELKSFGLLPGLFKSNWINKAIYYFNSFFDQWFVKN